VAASPIDASVATHFDRYDAFVEEVRVWLGVRADRFHWYYNSSRIGIVILSALIPSLTVGLFGDLGKAAVPYIALLIAVAAAVDGLLKPGDNWRHFRSYELALLRFRRVSQTRRAALELEMDLEKRRAKGFALYREFVNEIEGLLESESRLFFERQIQQLKDAKDAA
jgi:hypothetical protein